MYQVMPDFHSDKLVQKNQNKEMCVTFTLQVTVNWATSKKPVGTPLAGRGIKCRSAGTTEHVETSHCAIDDVFKYINERFKLDTPMGELNLPEPRTLLSVISY